VQLAEGTTCQRDDVVLLEDLNRVEVKAGDSILRAPPIFSVNEGLKAATVRSTVGR